MKTLKINWPKTNAASHNILFGSSAFYLKWVKLENLRHKIGLTQQTEMCVILKKKTRTHKTNPQKKIKVHGIFMCNNFGIKLLLKNENFVCLMHSYERFRRYFVQ